MRFLGFQDTLYPTGKPSRQYFADCYIEGNVAFIFGDARACFENCQIHSLTHDVVFITAPGTLFEMGKLTIEGLDVTTEPAIRKLWSQTEGKPYKAGYPQFFLDRVKEEGYLENVKDTRYEQHIAEAKRVVDVTLFFKGGQSKPPEKKN